LLRCAAMFDVALKPETFYYLLIASSKIRAAWRAVCWRAFYYLLIASGEVFNLAIVCGEVFLLSLDCFARWLRTAKGNKEAFYYLLIASRGARRGSHAGKTLSTISWLLLPPRLRPRGDVRRALSTISWLLLEQLLRLRFLRVVLSTISWLLRSCHH